jgi:gas vesicle protein
MANERNETMQDREDNHMLLNMLAGIGIGVIVGAIAGMVLAPKPGRETREELGAKIGDLGHKVGDISERVGKRVRSAVDAGRRVVEDLETEQRGA